MDADAEQAMLELLVSPLVDQVKPLSSATGGFYATLWCRNHADHPRRNSEQCQYTRTRTTPAQCLRDGGRAASRPCEGSQPSVCRAGLLAGRVVKGFS